MSSDLMDLLLKQLSAEMVEKQKIMLGKSDISAFDMEMIFNTTLKVCEFRIIKKWILKKTFVTRYAICYRNLSQKFD